MLEMAGRQKEDRMDDRIEQVISDMSGISDDVKKSFGALSESQLNWNPAETSWSIGQCLDHLIRTNDAFRPEFEKLVSRSRKNSFIENWSPFSGFFGRFLIKAVSDDAKKAKAPSKKIVPPSDISGDIVEQFEKNVSDMNSYVAACSEIDREKTVVTSPFLAIMTYKLDDAYTVLVEHTKRHVRQAKRVIEAEQFPK
jgi:hypothetical protein